MDIQSDPGPRPAGLCVTCRGKGRLLVRPEEGHEKDRRARFSPHAAVKLLIRCQNAVRSRGGDALLQRHHDCCAGCHDALLQRQHFAVLAVATRRMQPRGRGSPCDRHQLAPQVLQVTSREWMWTMRRMATAVKGVCRPRHPAAAAGNRETPIATSGIAIHADTAVAAEAAIRRRRRRAPHLVAHMIRQSGGVGVAGGGGAHAARIVPPVGVRRQSGPFLRRGPPKHPENPAGGAGSFSARAWCKKEWARSLGLGAC